ncbi:MAG: FAD-dependent oxidoreductase, partial [Candidatus Sungbacteria bacterium]|nr:FAD-dependent oxidoreductase [Candidatus Sungbacteria bacterium]
MPKKNIVILGAGFGGITAALTLAKGLGERSDEYEIILVDRHQHQLYTPALYEIAAIPRQSVSTDTLKNSILIPLSDIITGKAIRFLADEFIGLKPADKRILLRSSGEVAYEFCVFALGSETNYFDIPGLNTYGYPLKTFNDALRLRNAMEELAKKEGSGEVIIGGAGPSGVEIAAEFINFFCAIEASMGPGEKICRTRLTLVEASAEILPGFGPWIVRRARNRLKDLGIRIRTATKIQSVDQNHILYQDGAREPYDILVWTGGVKAPAILSSTGLVLADKGSLMANDYLEAAGGNGFVFSIGDNAALSDHLAGKPLPGNIPVAEAEARVAAKNILAAIKGRPKQKFIPRDAYPFVLALGRKYALADLAHVHISGLPGWCVKQLVELRYLVSILPLRRALQIWRLGIRI